MLEKAIVLGCSAVGAGLAMIAGIGKHHAAWLCRCRNHRYLRLHCSADSAVR